MSFHPEVLGTVQARVLQQTGKLLTPRQFYLVGGTALASHLGHRHSVDLDWFTGEPLADPVRLAQEIRDKGVAFATGRVDRATLHGRVAGVRVSLLEYRYPLLAPLVSWPEFDCRVASLDDMACMKLAAVAQRGAKKDFVDIHALGVYHRPLREMLRLYQEKYGVADVTHVLYGLVYFDDAEKERMPRMLEKIDWRTIKKTIQQWIRDLAP